MIIANTSKMATGIQPGNQKQEITYGDDEMQEW
jgi:hypothetical protein